MNANKLRQYPRRAKPPGTAARLLGLAAGMAAGCGSAAAAPAFNPAGKSVAQLEEALQSGATSSEALVSYYLERIRQLDRREPALHAVLAVNPQAREAARAADAERAAGHPRGPLQGIPILIKDNIETIDPLPTTAGSLALTGNRASHDAPVVAALRAAGAVVLGKTNLSEWANFRSAHSISGWSGVGGLTRNPYVLDRTACGSSAGSAAAMAAGLAAATLGTETDGSVTCPASMNGLVGLKPTLGVLPQAGIVPIAHSQDTAGPLVRSVADAALLMGVMVHAIHCKDVPACPEAEAYGALPAHALQGTRLGVIAFEPGSHPEMEGTWQRALATLRSAGATLVELKAPDTSALGTAEQKVLLTEFKADLEAYLARAPAAVQARTLDALIQFNRGSPFELEYFGQDLFEQAAATRGLEDPEYLKAREEARRMAGRDGIDRLLADNRLDALVAPTTSAAWRVDIVNGDRGGDSFTTLPAVAGYPHLSVPMGAVRGLPVGLSFIGTAGNDTRLLALGADFEQRSHARTEPRLLPTLETESLARPSPRAHARRKGDAG